MPGLATKLCGALKRLDYSRHSARAFLTLFLPVIGASALGQALHPGPGAGYGVAGGCVLGCLIAYRLSRTRRRDEDWMKPARAAGLKAIYSGHAPAIGLEGFRSLENLVGGSADGVQLLVGDRMEWYADRSTKAALGTSETHRLETSAPHPEETFFALWIPGLRNQHFAMGKRKSLWSGDQPSPPDDAEGAALRTWVHAHPGWRLEGYDNLVVGTRPNHVASPEELGEYIRSAWELSRSLRPVGVGHSGFPIQDS